MQDLSSFCCQSEEIGFCGLSLPVGNRNLLFFHPQFYGLYAAHPSLNLQERTLTLPKLSMNKPGKAKEYLLKYLAQYERLWRTTASEQYDGATPSSNQQK